eukprot:4180666-Alexandrium_andersonii.AAC.1
MGSRARAPMPEDSADRGSVDCDFAISQLRTSSIPVFAGRLRVCANSSAERTPSGSSGTSC